VREISRERSDCGQDAVLLACRYRCVASGPDRASRTIDTIRLETLFDMLRLNAAEREPLLDPKRACWFDNGYQPLPSRSDRKRSLLSVEILCAWAEGRDGARRSPPTKPRAGKGPAMEWTEEARALLSVIPSFARSGENRVLRRRSWRRREETGGKVFAQDIFRCRFPLRPGSAKGKELLPW
jgi:hypothetical protein